jgi:hypothetical protein
MEHLDISTLRSIILSQFRASLLMLRDAIEKYPSERWISDGHTNAPWQIAYHTLYFAEYYTRPTWENYAPWLNQGREVQVPDSIPGPPDPNSSLPLIPDPFTQVECLSYVDHLLEQLPSVIDEMDITNSSSGFWYTCSKLEHQIVTIRHNQHGAAQLADRIRAIADVGVDWVGHTQPKKELA